MEDEFYNRVREAITAARQSGRPATAVRMSKARLDRMQGNLGIDYSTGGPRIDGVPLLVDDSCGFETFDVERSR